MNAEIQNLYSLETEHLDYYTTTGPENQGLGTVGVSEEPGVYLQGDISNPREIRGEYIFLIFETF